MDFDALEPGSQDLFDSLYVDGEPESRRTLAIEAVRQWNRLCKFDRLLSGDLDTWLTLQPKDDGTVHVYVDSVASAARTLASSYRMLIAEILRQRGDSTQPVADSGDDLDGVTDDED